MRREVLRPGDVVVALRLAMHPGEPYVRLSEALGISLSVAHRAVKRLEQAGLVLPDRRSVDRRGLLDFLEHGVHRGFFAQMGPEAMGVPTAHSAPALAGEFDSRSAVVWPSVKGTTRGAALMPLYPQAPDLPERCPELYDALTLVDAIRIGRVRERTEAMKRLRDLVDSQGRRVSA